MLKIMAIKAEIILERLYLIFQMSFIEMVIDNHICKVSAHR